MNSLIQKFIDRTQADRNTATDQNALTFTDAGTRFLKHLGIDSGEEVTTDDLPPAATEEALRLIDKADQKLLKLNSDLKFGCENLEYLLGDRQKRKELAREVGKKLSSFGVDINSIQNNGQPKDIINFENIDPISNTEILFNQTFDAVHHVLKFLYDFIEACILKAESKSLDSDAVEIDRDIEIPPEEKELLRNAVKSLLSFFNDVVESCSSFNIIDHCHRFQLACLFDSLKQINLDLPVNLDANPKIQKSKILGNTLLGFEIEIIADNLIEGNPTSSLRVKNKLDEFGLLNLDEIKQRLSKIMPKLFKINYEEWYERLLLDEEEDDQEEVLDYIVLKALYNSEIGKDDCYTVEKLQRDFKI